MIKNRKLRNLEAAFDASPQDGPALETMANADPASAQWLRHLQQLRAHGAQVREQTPAIDDDQFRNFFAGVREGIEAPAPARGFRRGWWALASLSTAALLVAFSAFWMMTEGPQPVGAEVETVSSDVEGATFDVYDTEQGVPTVWVTLAEDDLL